MLEKHPIEDETIYLHILFQYQVCPIPDNLEQSLDVILACKGFSIGIHEISILHLRLDLLQLLLQVLHFGRRELKNRFRQRLAYIPTPKKRKKKLSYP